MPDRTKNRIAISHEQMQTKISNLTIRKTCNTFFNLRRPGDSAFGDIVGNFKIFIVAKNRAGQGY